MKVKVYALFCSFETEDEYGDRDERTRFINLYGSENAVMQEIEDRVMAEYYCACDCFDERIELERKYGGDSGRIFDFRILEQNDKLIRYSWCGDITTLFWDVYEIDADIEFIKAKLSRESLRALKQRQLKHLNRMKIKGGDPK